MTPLCLCATESAVGCLAINGLLAAGLIAIGVVGTVATVFFLQLLSERHAYAVRSYPLAPGWRCWRVITRD